MSWKGALPSRPRTPPMAGSMWRSPSLHSPSGRWGAGQRGLATQAECLSLLGVAGGGAPPAPMPACSPRSSQRPSLGGTLTPGRTRGPAPREGPQDPREGVTTLPAAPDPVPCYTIVERGSLSPGTRTGTTSTSGWRLPHWHNRSPPASLSLWLVSATLLLSSEHISWFHSLNIFQSLIYR